MLALDDDELRAAASLLNASSSTEDAASIAVGKVRLQARGLLTGPSLNAAVAEALRTCLRPEDRLSVEVHHRGGEAINVTFSRLGTMVVAHSRARVPDGELHVFATVGDVVDELMALLHAAPDATASGAQVLHLDGLEQARQAAASGDRQAIAAAIQEAGADAALTRELVETFMAAEVLAQFTRQGDPPHTVMVLSGRGAVWTFTSQAEGTARVERPCAEVLREQLARLWAT